MNKLKERLLAYRKTLNFLGIERELELHARTFKMWFGQNTEPSEEVQKKIVDFLNDLGRELSE